MATCDVCGKSCRKKCGRCQKDFCAKHLFESGICFDCVELSMDDAEDIVAQALGTRYVGELDDVFVDDEDDW